MIATVVSVVLTVLAQIASGFAAAFRWLARLLLTSPHAAAVALVALAAASYWSPDLAWYAAVIGLPAGAGLLLWHDSEGPPTVAMALAPPGEGCSDCPFPLPAKDDPDADVLP